MERTHLKSEKDWLEKWEGLTLNMEGLSQNRVDPIQKYDNSNSKKEGLADTSQPSYLTDVSPRKSIFQNFFHQLLNFVSNAIQHKLSRFLLLLIFYR